MGELNIGTIISCDGSPSTTKFSFVIDPNNKNKIKKGQYVQTKVNGGILLGYVGEIVRSNRYFERAESIIEYEKSGKFREQFPLENWEFLMAETKVLGMVSDESSNKFTRAFVPAYPGSVVYKANEKLLKRFLGFIDGGINLGKLQHHNLDVNLDLTKLFQKHLAILAMSGAGKSYLASVLLEEIMDRVREQGRLAVVIIDIHGEYSGLAEDKQYGNKVKVVYGSSVKIPYNSLSMPKMLTWFPETTRVGGSLLREVMEEMREEAREKQAVFGLDDLYENVKFSKRGKDNTREPLMRVLNELKSYRLISKTENPRLTKDIKSGNILVVDLSDLENMKKKRIIVSHIGNELFKLRKNKKIPPFLFLVEEAHNFATEKMDKFSNISKPIIEKIAREGRKFGACLCLISQRPANLSTTALSQCNTHIILRVTNPNDLKYIESSSEGIDSHMQNYISSLKIGEGIIVGEAVKYPVFVEVRKRKSKTVEKGIPLNEQAKEFEDELEKKKEDVEAFL